MLLMVVPTAHREATPRRAIGSGGRLSPSPRRRRPACAQQSSARPTRSPSRQHSPRPSRRPSRHCWRGSARLARISAAHVYQSSFFHERGFTLWNNFWYSGRYSFVTYSTLYYPLASLLGIRLLAVASIATAALAFTVVVARQWGPAARWSNRSFAVVWAGIVLSGAFPFALGIALALLALLGVAGRRARPLRAPRRADARRQPGRLRAARGPPARQRDREQPARARELIAPAADDRGDRARRGAPLAPLPRPAGSFPFSGQELAAASVFCLIGIGHDVARAARRAVLRWIFVVYLVACVDRLTSCRLTSARTSPDFGTRRSRSPILALSLRHWRPLLPCLVALGLAVAWNVSPLAASFTKGAGDPAADAAYWAPTISFLHAHLTPDYRVEAVDTAGHWPAEYLPGAGIPIVRGWFRQDDFPQNSLLYGKPGRVGVPALAALARRALRRAPRRRARLQRAGTRPRSLERALRAARRVSLRAHDVYAVPAPTPLVTGPGPGERALVRPRPARRSGSVLRAAIAWRRAGRRTGRRTAAASPADADGMVGLTVARRRVGSN